MTVAAFVLGLAIGFLAGRKSANRMSPRLHRVAGRPSWANVAGDEDRRLELIERWMEERDNELS